MRAPETFSFQDGASHIVLLRGGLSHLQAGSSRRAVQMRIIFHKFQAVRSNELALEKDYPG